MVASTQAEACLPHLLPGGMAGRHETALMTLLGTRKGWWTLRDTTCPQLTACKYYKWACLQQKAQVYLARGCLVGQQGCCGRLADVTNWIHQDIMQDTILHCMLLQQLI